MSKKAKQKMVKGKKISIIFMFIMLLIMCTGCGKGEEPQQSVENQKEVTVEESTEVQESVVEESAGIEESTEEASMEEEQATELSDEEWFKSLNLTDARFMIFNGITGERLLLENGQEYTLQEGDVLAFWFPWDCDFVDFGPDYLYNDLEGKIDCLFIDLNYDQIGENSELILHVEDSEGNDVYTSVILSK